MHPARWYVQTCERDSLPAAVQPSAQARTSPPVVSQIHRSHRRTKQVTNPNQPIRAGPDCGVLRPPGRLLPRPLDPSPPTHHHHRGGVCRWWGGEGWSLLSFSNTRGHVEVMCVNRVSGALRVKRGNQGSRVWTGWMPHASWYSISFLPSLACLLHSHVSFCHEQPRMSA